MARSCRTTPPTRRTPTPTTTATPTAPRSPPAPTRRTTPRTRRRASAPTRGAAAGRALTAVGQRGHGAVEDPREVVVEVRLGPDRCVVGPGIIVLRHVEQRSEHEARGVDRLHERHQLLLVERHLAPRLAELG